MTGTTLDGRMFIDGERVWATTNETIATANPADGAELIGVAEGGIADIDAAVSAATRAHHQWRRRPPGERAAILFEVADAIIAARDELADIESVDVGKPRREALADVTAAAAYFRFYAGLADKLLGTSIPVGFGRHDFTVREPIGVSAQIVPWNYPMQLSSRGIAPALACGNAVVVKPAHEAGLTVAKMSELATAAGLPPGLWNVVTGDGRTGAALVSHPGIHHITFTGSVPTGAAVMQAAAANVVPVTLELGGKSPMIVFADADLDRAAATTAAVILQNAGQTCSAASRLVVAAEVHDEVVANVGAALGAARLGPGTTDPDIGPLVSARQRDRVDSAVGTAIDAGRARAHTGGRRGRPEGFEDGFYYEPTLLVDVDPTDAIAQEEVFGPVVVALPFSSVDDAIVLADATPYGLVAGVWTNDLRTAHRVAQEVTCGQVFVNGYGAGGGVALPFGGRGKSGFGREKGVEALHNYTTTKNVMIHFEPTA